MLARSLRYEEFLACLKLTSQAQLALIHKALRFIKKYHGPVKRKSGEPFYLQPIMVAKIVTSFTREVDVILAALLHNILEDTAVTLSQIRLMFNAHVSKIVDGATQLDSLSKAVYRLKLGEYKDLTELLDAEDEEVLYVKLAERIHYLRTIDFHTNVFEKKKIAGETLSFFVPAAKHLGLEEVAEELKTTSNQIIESEF